MHACIAVLPERDTGYGLACEQTKVLPYKLNRDFARYDAALEPNAKQPLHSFASALCVVERQIVDPHANESIR